MKRFGVMAVAALVFQVVAATAAQARPVDRQKVASLYKQSYAAEAIRDYEGAIASMKEIAALGVDDYVLHLRLGWLSYLSGRYEQAIAEYRKAIQKAPKALEPKLGIMLPMMALRRYRDALDVGIEVLRAAPTNFLAQSRVAFCYYQMGRYRDAEKWYRKALQGFPSNVDMRVGLAWSLLKQGRKEEARRHFESALLVAPDHPTANQGYQFSISKATR